MSTPEVRCNLVVIRSSDLDRSEKFYSALGLDFTRHSHGKGPVHLACERAGHVFEIYPIGKDGQETTAARIGFAVPSVDDAFVVSLAVGGSEVSAPQDSPWGRRAVVSDPDGHRVELTSTTLSNT